MLSRFTRMSSLGAHLASSGCSVLKEPTPSKPVAKVDSSRWNSSFRVSVEKSLGLSPDPFLWHDHENFLAELAELDNLKNELPSTSRASPERQSPQPDDTEEWSGILNNMEWIDRTDVLDIPKIDADYSLESVDASLQNGADDFLEKTSSLIDWKAWNSYLGSDEEMDVKPERSATQDCYHTRSISCAPTNCSETQSEGNDFLSSIDSVPSLSSVEVKTEDEESSLASVDIMLKEVAIDSRVGEIEKAIYRASGPLTWLPSTGSSERDSRTSHNCSSESFEDRPLKRRGVKMKPPSDEETNHRRFLNREAAFRYRERKRMEQLERKRELDQLTHRNILLKQQVSDLRQEIASFRWKLDNVAS